MQHICLYLGVCDWLRQNQGQFTKFIQITTKFLENKIIQNMILYKIP
jgi:hypothetical protein